ncbi:hypothetical protein GWI33_003971 [Rhynchophorus ferrugineus]|uniref:Uncharacterized protein n=1 Tax=Rhynchophorus ferrugineus TaxID=354439 RepID=A0A834IJA7_RHYFE|nr:hypothetical protein GWI33_003971 [Rhynchophorus ferrugineus]
MQSYYCHRINHFRQMANANGPPLLRPLTSPLPPSVQHSIFKVVGRATDPGGISYNSRPRGVRQNEGSTRAAKMTGERTRERDLLTAAAAAD